jgi:hypothetical protein
MNKKYPKSDAIEDQKLANEEAYVVWGDDLSSKQEALRKSSESLVEYNGIERANNQEKALARRTRLDFSNLDTNVSGRPGLLKSDYDAFRPEEAVPVILKQILRRADQIYQRVGLVKNVIDLMGDFAVQGIRIVHPNKKIERFYRSWFKKINGKDRSERFVNNLYRVGNVVINRQTAKLNTKYINYMYRATAEADITYPSLDDDFIGKKEIPWKYTFIDPVYVDVMGGSLSSFTNKKIYGVMLPATLKRIINAPKNDAESSIVNELPSDIIESAKTKKPYVLNPDKTLVFHYKKDDWQIWAYPMIYAIMDDITVLEKLKLADMCALDGAVSNLRIFKLGSLEHKIAPTKAAASKLSSILSNNVGGGTMDLVWGPDIELIESKSTVHNFLGEGKYTPHLNSVYAGLGIPPTLTGTYGAAGTTNNFISLKTLTQRLQYGRDVLVNFWEKEIELVQKAMGFKIAAKIEFDRMDLSNEDAEKALLIQLADRNIISDEHIQMRFGLDPSMEKHRINRESKDRNNKKMPQKASPFFDANFETNLKKIALQLGIATPSQVGLELMDKKRGEKNLLELKLENTMPKIPPQSPGPTGVSGQGRPRNSKDSTQRKTKQFAPQTGAKIALWAQSAQDTISKIINPHLLAFYSKGNLRQLSSDESKEVDTIKTKLLFSLKPLSNISEEILLNSLANINDQKTLDMNNNFKFWLNKLSSELDRNLSSDENKAIKASFYAAVYENLITE